MSDITKFRQFIENGYSTLQITVDNLGQTIIKFSLSSKNNSIGETSYFLTTQDPAVIYKAHEVFTNYERA